MNDEIKEILAYFEEYVKITDMHDSEPMLNWKDLKIVLDYITNLQQENERLKAQLTDTEWEYQNTRCKYEKQYKKGITEELLEDIETCFFNRENPSMIPIDSLDVCHIFGYIDYLKDYKTCCEKAIEITGNLLKTEKSGYYQIIFKQQLNILQNGSEK